MLQTTRKWSSTVEQEYKYTDVKFEYAVRVLSKLLEKLKRSPEDEEIQSGFCEALQTVKLLHNDISRRYGTQYGGGAEKLYKVVKKADILLPKKRNSSQIIQSIRRHMKEICKIAPMVRTEGCKISCTAKTELYRKTSNTKR